MAHYIAERPRNYCSCRWTKNASGKGELIIDDPHKIYVIENSPFFRKGIIVRVDKDFEKDLKDSQPERNYTPQQPKKEIPWNELRKMATARKVPDRNKKNRAELEKELGV